MENSLVSIVTVCFNSEKTIERTIKSVLNQTYKNIEYIIIDGASTDHTLEIVKRYEPYFEGRMTIVSEKDNGIYDAMNKGIQRAKGSLIGIINSDDFYEENAVETIVNHMSQEKYQILYGMTRILKNEMEESISICSHHFLKERPMSHPACFVAKEIYNDFGGYDLKYPYVADYDFLLRMQKQKAVSFIPVYQLIVNFSLGGACASDGAYQDLIKMQRDYGMITKQRYYRIKLQGIPVVLKRLGVKLVNYRGRK